MYGMCMRNMCVCMRRICARTEDTIIAYKATMEKASINVDIYTEKNTQRHMIKFNTIQRTVCLLLISLFSLHIGAAIQNDSMGDGFPMGLYRSSTRVHIAYYHAALWCSSLCGAALRV